MAHTWDPDDLRPPEDDWAAVDIAFGGGDFTSIRIEANAVELTLRPEAVQKLHLMRALPVEGSRETSDEPTTDPFTIDSLTVYRYRVYVAGQPMGWWAHPILENDVGKLVLETAPDEAAQVIQVFETALGCTGGGR